MIGRMPVPGEIEALTHLLAEQRDYFTSEPDAAEKLTAVGKVQVDEKTAEAYPRREIAAWTMVANTVMNMDAFYMIR